MPQSNHTPDGISRVARREKEEARLEAKKKKTRRETVSEKGMCGLSRTNTRRQEKKEEQ